MNADAPSLAVEAEMTLATLTGLAWHAGQTKWRGWIIAYTRLTFNFPAGARLVLYAPDGRRHATSSTSGVTARELEYKTLAWGIGTVLAAGGAP